MDEAAFAAFYAATYRPLWAFVRRASGDAALADDVVQDAYIRLLQARTDGLSAAQLRSYLYRTATNLLRDHWRRSSREVPEDEARCGRARERADSSPADACVRRLDLESALERMTERERTILWLAHAEGFEHRDIARMTGLGHRSVRVLLHRARRKLAALLVSREGKR